MKTIRLDADRLEIGPGVHERGAVMLLSAAGSILTLVFAFFQVTGDGSVRLWTLGLMAGLIIVVLLIAQELGFRAGAIVDLERGAISRWQGWPRRELATEHFDSIVSLEIGRQAVGRKLTTTTLRKRERIRIKVLELKLVQQDGKSRLLALTSRRARLLGAARELSEQLGVKLVDRSGSKREEFGRTMSAVLPRNPDPIEPRGPKYQKRPQVEHAALKEPAPNPRYRFIAPTIVVIALAISIFVLYLTRGWHTLPYTLGGTLLYFLPTLCGRKVMRLHVLFAANAMLGFTVIGWLVCWGWTIAGERYTKYSEGRLRLESEQDERFARRTRLRY